MYALRPQHLGRPRRVPSILRAWVQAKWTMADAHGSGGGKRKLGLETSVGSVRGLQSPIAEQGVCHQLVGFLEGVQHVGQRHLDHYSMRVGALAGMGATPYGATPYSMNGRPQPHLGSDSSPDVDLFSGLPGLPEQSSSLQGLVDHSITLTQASPLFTRRAPIMPGLPSPLEIEDKAEKLERLERDLERSVYDEAVTNIKQVQETLFESGKGTSLARVHRVILEWHETLAERLEMMRDRLRAGEHKGQPFAGTYGPIFDLLPPKKLAVIVAHETVNACIKAGNEGLQLTRLLLQIGDAVQLEVNCLKLQQKYGKGVMQRLKEDGTLSIKKVNKTARQALEDGIWMYDLKLQVGSMLLKELMESAKMEIEGRGEVPVFRHGKQVLSKYKKNGMHVKHGVIVMDEEVFRDMTEFDEGLRPFLLPRFRPMLVEPNDWTAFNEGGYRELKTFLIRCHGSRVQLDALRDARMPQVYEALNFLGRIKWRINQEVYDVVKEAWEKKAVIAELPDQEDMQIPPPDFQEVRDLEVTEENADFIAAEKVKKREYYQLQKRIKKRNAEMYSLRCDLNIKLAIADQFVDKEFYFPYNMDFRGRAYPVPPNLNHLGSDLCRGILVFAEKKPLGANGLRWLKIQLANLFGKDKVSFDGRVEWVEEMMDEVYDSAKMPLDGRGWWMKADEPWQALATCKEIVAALESGSPETYCSGLPVHMDGSCNGLQHYAALGRDEQGGTKDDAPESEKRNHKYAKMVNGMIDRKVVKQTVMTSVYGVTFIGARKQIQARLMEKFEAELKSGMLTKEQEQEIYQAARYVATVTLSSLAELFSSARLIMEWLADCSSLVAKQGQPMSWVTPLGLPVIQPYRRESGHQVRTLMQTVVLVDCNDKLPVSPQKQRSAFPPNFVHSLDSTHMLLTAIELKKKGIPFTAVHDSYWSHAGNVEVMNETLRECFVDLYRKPILENLRESLVARYPGVHFPEIPDRGTLDLDKVLDSPYFFD